MIACNWKLHKDADQAEEFIGRLKEQTKGYDKAEIVIAPSYVCLERAKHASEGSCIHISAQDVSAYEEGAYTGEVAAKMLAPFCRYCIVGHSERRHIFGDSDDTVRRKLEACIKHGLVPILCIGETKEDRDSHNTEEVLRRQLSVALSCEPAEHFKENELVVAYEPVWAISNGDSGHEPATPDDAHSCHLFIKDILREILGRDDIRVLYGGSVKPENIAGFMALESVDGALVGNASLELDSFVALLKSI